MCGSKVHSFYVIWYGLQWIVTFFVFWSSLNMYDYWFVSYAINNNLLCKLLIKNGLKFSMKHAFFKFSFGGHAPRPPSMACYVCHIPSIYNVHPLFRKSGSAFDEYVKVILTLASLGWLQHCAYGRNSMYTIRLSCIIYQHILVGDHHVSITQCL